MLNSPKIGRLPVGTDTMTAVYNGNAKSARSTSAPLSQIVNP